jgi:hypothetical protein
MTKLRAGRPGFDSQQGQWRDFFSPRRRVRTDSWGSLGLLSSGYRGKGISLGVKRPGRDADNSPLSSAEVKNVWSYTSTPLYVFMAWYWVKHGDKFAFTFTFKFKQPSQFCQDSQFFGGNTCWKGPCQSPGKVLLDDIGIQKCVRVCVCVFNVWILKVTTSPIITIIPTVISGPYITTHTN